MDVPASLTPFFRGARLSSIPRKQGPRRAVLDLVASEFEPGRRYSEAEVNAVLSRYHADYCTLRRYLVDEEFLDRTGGRYWRVGGTFDVD